MYTTLDHLPRRSIPLPVPQVVVLSNRYLDEKRQSLLLNSFSQFLQTFSAQNLGKLEFRAACKALPSRTSEPSPSFHANHGTTTSN